jgi:hypothetical protein
LSFDGLATDCSLLLEKTSTGTLITARSYRLAAEVADGT